MSRDGNRGTSVYFAQADYGGPIKIGHSYNRTKRLEAIGKSLPFNVVEIGSFPGGLFAERFVQCWFRASQVKGEWFEPTPELWRWALQARTRKCIPEVPPEPPRLGQISGRMIRVRMEHARIGITDVADAIGMSRLHVERSISAEIILSVSLMAAVAVCAVRRGDFFDWDGLAYVPDQPRAHRIVASLRQNLAPAVPERAAS